MKITEPKTPYVRYNPETDEVEGMSVEIPPFTLDGRSRSPSNISNSNPVSPTLTSPPLVESDRESRRASFGNPPSRSSGSASSSRRTSFNLPEDARMVRDGSGLHGDEVELDEEMDEETAARHAAFVRARGRHYSNEAEAMKRAQQLMAQDDEIGDDKEDDVEEDVEAAFADDDEEPSGEEVMTRIPGQNGVPSLPSRASKLNGITHGNRAS